MADEFTPEASVDFEALAAMAAQATNGDGPHFQPPPEQAPPQAPPIRPHTQPRAAAPRSGQSTVTDPFAALEQIIGDQSLMFRELGDVNAKLGVLQLQTVIMFGSALLLAVIVWKFARSTE